MLHITRQALQNHLDDDTTLPLYHAFMLLPTEQGKIEHMGVPLVKTVIMTTSVTNSKTSFIRELLANLERRFPEDGIYISIDN